MNAALPLHRPFNPLARRLWCKERTTRFAVIRHGSSVFLHRHAIVLHVAVVYARNAATALVHNLGAQWPTCIATR